MKLNIGNILTRAWQIVWNYKILWVFGIFASFAESNGGNSNNNRGSSNNGCDIPLSGNQFTDRIQDFFQDNLIIIIAVCGLIILLSIVFYSLGMMGRIGLLKGVFKVEDGATQLVFGELWSESMPYFWRFFGINFVVFLGVLIIVIPIVILAAATAGVILACLIPLICLLLPVAWLVSLILEQAQASIVKEDLGIMDAFRRGWELVKANIWDLVVMSLILGIGGGFIGVVIAAPLILSLLPLIFSADSLQGFSSLPPSVWISLACCTAYLPVLIFLNGVLTAYVKSVWALVYLEIAQPSVPSNNNPIELQANA